MSYVVAVRALCEFTAKQGDLDLRFTPAPSSQEGIEGHQLVAARRGPGYEAELSLQGTHKGLSVRGRADGYDPVTRRLEEVKTFKGRLDTQPDSHRQLHWAQLKVYGALLCQQSGLEELELALVYFNVGSQQETVLTQRCGAAELQQHFELLCDRFLAWAGQELEHRQARDAGLTALQFPFDGFREGQRALAEAVYRAASNGLCLLAQAPTGIGKTVGTLFPLLKAAPTEQLDKVFFLAAKTSGRQLALDALQRINARPLRVLELVARDKACEHPDKACHGQSCPLAAGFYDRLPVARRAAVAQASALNQATLRALALEHHICPYYLSQEMVRWSDVVVGDYNYYFDVTALLHGFTGANQWKVGLLVDEAHNLVERGRKMYSAELQPAGLAAARKSQAAGTSAALKKALDKVHRAWNALNKAQEPDYQVYDSFPDKLLLALQQCSSAITEHLAEHPTQVDTALQGFYFEALHLVRMAELLDRHSLVDMGRQPGIKGAVLSVRNLVPAPFLRHRFEACRTSTLFSATLQPPHYFSDLLGLPESHRGLEVASPFSAEQLRVRVAGHISTRYQRRAASLAPIAALMADQFKQQPGNYLAFFSSYDYLQQVAQQFMQDHPEIPLWQQSRRMAEAEQQQFLARFTDHSRGIGFAVLGGSFAEGIDLPGRRLIGAFVATLGLPQINPVNEQIKLRMQALFGAGYDYTYLYPGLQKVVQAAGRVIRGSSDRGVVHLIDDRFARAEVQALLPSWWKVEP
ncbi:MAG: ATP-dependent DNA helicase [Burkholderiaceae bacterium]|nr:ATP-dependent DNA helicase [Burkholderiaceae bacterium]